MVRTAATRVAPDPERLREFAEVIRHASNPVLIYGAAIARGNGWKQAVALAEALNAPVWAAPSSERVPFPEDDPLYVGGLPFAMGPLSDKLAGHDVVLVVGAPVFRYYPYVPGPYLPPGLRLLHISDDPAETGRAGRQQPGRRRRAVPGRAHRPARRPHPARRQAAPAAAAPDGAAPGGGETGPRMACCPPRRSSRRLPLICRITTAMRAMLMR